MTCGFELAGCQAAARPWCYWQATASTTSRWHAAAQSVSDRLRRAAWSRGVSTKAAIFQPTRSCASARLIAGTGNSARSAGTESRASPSARPGHHERRPPTESGATSGERRSGPERRRRFPLSLAGLLRPDRQPALWQPRRTGRFRGAGYPGRANLRDRNRRRPRSGRCVRLSR